MFLAERGRADLERYGPVSVFLRVPLVLFGYPFPDDHSVGNETKKKGKHARGKTKGKSTGKVSTKPRTNDDKDGGEKKGGKGKKAKEKGEHQERSRARPGDKEAELGGPQRVKGVGGQMREEKD